jgi:hypothetical protein
VTQVEQRHPAPGQVAAGQLGLDAVLAGRQPVHSGVGLIGGRPGDAQVRSEVTSSHQQIVDSLEAGRATRETISA